MWILRAIVGLMFLGVAVASVPVWFDRPITVIVTMVFAVLGLWTMGYVSRFSTQKTLEEDARKEREIRESKSFGLRNRVMGAIALFMGVAFLFSAHQSHWELGWKPIAGGVMFVILGGWYLIKGRDAE